MSSVNISIARYANASSSASICRTSLSLFIWPASSLILPIHNWPCTAWVPLAFDVSHQYPSQALCPALSWPLPLECLPSIPLTRPWIFHTPGLPVFLLSPPRALSLALSACGDIHVNGPNTKALFRPDWFKFFPIGPLTHRWNKGSRDPSYKAEAPLSNLSFSEFLMFHQLYIRYMVIHKVSSCHGEWIHWWLSIVSGVICSLTFQIYIFLFFFCVFILIHFYFIYLFCTAVYS